MKFSIEKDALITSLQSISSVIEKRQTMPVLANILLVAEAATLTMTGTNTEVELVAQLQEINLEQEGRTTVPAKKFFDICRSLPEKAVLEVESKDSRLQIKCGKSQFLLSTLPAEHFPNVEDEEASVEVVLPQIELKRLINATAFAMAQQDVRYYLNGMLLELHQEGLRTVTTDGHRLALAGTAINVGITESRQPIIPRKAILELSRLLDDSEENCKLVFADKNVRAYIRHYIFTTKLIDGKFPDYQRVIPRGGNKTMVADRLVLKEVLSRASILSHESIRGVRLQFSAGELRAFANNPEQEEAEDSMEIEYDFESLQIGFNVSYLIDVLNVLTDNLVKMTLSDSNSSALVEGIESRDAVYVVMPMRL